MDEKKVVMIVVYIAVQLLCIHFKFVIAEQWPVGPVDQNAPNACLWEEKRDPEQYRCCDGYYLLELEGKCEECPADKFGYGCEEACKCWDYEQCDFRDALCHCTDNLWGVFCENSCTSCESFEVCDRHSGACQCPRGKYGSQCQYGCLDRCFNHASCERGSGGCSCVSGWKGDGCTDCDTTKSYGDGRGPFCDTRCIHCTNGESCSIDKPGDCKCTAGWTGGRCDTPCDFGYFGENCQSQCECSDKMQCDAQFGCVCLDGEDCLAPSNTVVTETTKPTEKNTESGEDDTSRITSSQEADTTTTQEQEIGTTTPSGAQVQGTQTLIPVVVGGGVVLLVVLVVIVVLIIVCLRRKSASTKRQVHYENVDRAMQRTDTIEMTGNSSDPNVYELTDLPEETPAPDFSRFGQSDHTSGNNTGMPEYAQVMKPKKERTQEKDHAQSENAAPQGYTEVGQFQDELPPNIHYYTLEEVDNTPTGEQTSLDSSTSGVGEEEDQNDPAYNVVDRTGKLYKPKLKEDVNYDTLFSGTGDEPSNTETTDYNKLDFGPKRLPSNMDTGVEYTDHLRL